MTTYLELRTAAELSSIRVLNDLLDVALKALGADDASRHDLALGVAELVANVCQHEYADGGEVVVRLEATPQDLQLTVTSQGPPFDLQAALTSDPDPLAGAGLGLPLLVGLFDSVDHRYEERLGNRITLIKKHSPAA